MASIEVGHKISSGICIASEIELSFLCAQGDWCHRLQHAVPMCAGWPSVRASSSLQHPRIWLEDQGLPFAGRPLQAALAYWQMWLLAQGRDWSELNWLFPTVAQNDRLPFKRIKSEEKDYRPKVVRREDRVGGESGAASSIDLWGMQQFWREQSCSMVHGGFPGKASVADGSSGLAACSQMLL